MKRNLFYFFILISFFSLSVIYSCDHIEYTGYVYGTVKSEDGSSALSDVIVECGGKTYTTTSNGNYTLKDIPVGDQRLTASKTDFATYSKTVNIESNGTREDIFMVSAAPGRK